MDRSVLTPRILIALFLVGYALPESAQASDLALRRCYQPDNGYDNGAAYASMRRYQPDRAYSAEARFSANARFKPVARFQARKALVVHPVGGKKAEAPRVSGWFAGQAKDHKPRPVVLDNLSTWNQLDDIGLKSVLRQVTSPTASESPAVAYEGDTNAKSNSALATARSNAAEALLEWESKLKTAQDSSLSARDQALAARAMNRAQTMAHRAVVAIMTLENRAHAVKPSGLDWRAVELWLVNRSAHTA